MTSAHFIYIPMILLAGTILGFILGGRAARDQFELQRRKEEQRAAAKAARKQAQSATAAPASTTTEPPAEKAQP